MVGEVMLGWGARRAEKEKRRGESRRQRRKRGVREEREECERAESGFRHCFSLGRHMTRRRANGQAAGAALGPPPGLTPGGERRGGGKKSGGGGSADVIRQPGPAPAAPPVSTPAPAPAPAPTPARPQPPRPDQQTQPHHHASHHPSLAHAALALILLSAVWAAAVGAGIAMAASQRFDTGRHAAPPHFLWFDRALRAGGPILVAPVVAARAVAGWIRNRAATTPLHHRHPLASRSVLRAATIYGGAAAVRLGLYAPHQAGFLGAALEAGKEVAARPRAEVVAAVAERARGTVTALTSTPLPVTLRAAAEAGRAALHAARAAAQPHAGRHLMSDHLLLGACLAGLLAVEAGALAASTLAARAAAGAGRPHPGPAHSLALHAGLALAVGAYLALAADMAVTAAHFHEPRESLLAAGLGAMVFQAPLAAWLVRTWPAAARRRWRERGEPRRRKNRERRSGGKGGGGGGGGGL